MNNNFESFVRFFKPDGQDRTKNLFEPTDAMTTPLIAKGGDNWRFLVPKSDVGTVNISDIRVDLYGKQQGSCSTYDLVQSGVGFLRRQQSELYYEMIIKVNNAPTVDTYKQFALVRENGKEVFGTFRSQETDFDKYCFELQEWLEAYPHTRVDVIKDGNLLKIRAWENGHFRIRNEKVNIGIGTSLELNANTPQLTKQFVETYSRAAYRTYDLVIGDDIEEGNIFQLKTTTYTAKKSDTAATIKAALLGTESKVKFLNTEPISLSVTLGVKKTVNTNTPQINYYYQNSSGGQDKYRIEVSDFQKGNIFQVLISSEAPITYTVQEGDTEATIESILNPDTGNVLSVSSGSTITVNAVAGVRVDDNTNLPKIYVENKQDFAALTVDKYRIFVGTSVRENNKFVLDSFEIVANEVDTYLTIAQKLGLVDGLYYEIATGQGFVCYAQKGGLYNSSNIADVQVISSPIRRVSGQYLCDVSIPINLPNGKYNFVLNKVVGESIEAIASSNFFEADDLTTDTALVRFADVGEVFGYEYFETGLCQQVRTGIFLKNEKLETTTIQRQSVNDASVKGDTQIRKKFDFTVKSGDSTYHRALNFALQHRLCFVNDKKISLIDYNHGDEIGAKKVKVATGQLYEDRYLMKNYGKLFLTEDNFKEKISVKVNFNEKIVAIVIYNDYFRQEILEEGEVFLPVGEYKWKAFVAGALGETTHLRIFQNGVKLNEFVLICGRWNKCKTLIRTYPSDSLSFIEVYKENNISNIDTTLETVNQYDSISSYVSEVGDISLMNGVIVPFEPLTESTEGQWRRAIDESGNYVIQVYASGIWETKHIIG